MSQQVVFKLAQHANNEESFCEKILTGQTKEKRKNIGAYEFYEFIF